MSHRPSTTVISTLLLRQRARRRAAGVGSRHLLLAIAAFVWAASVPFRPMAAAAEAAPGVWSAEEVAGTVSVRSAGQTTGSWQPLAAATPIDAESEVRTGSDGTALLANGADRIRMAPNSRITLPDTGSGLLTLIRQHIGRVLFEVAPRTEGRFEVEAPYLAVLVKGTHFVVNANYIENSVSVVQGDVHTRRARGNTDDGADVGGGQSVDIAGPNGTLTVSQTGSSDSGDLEASNGGPEEKVKVRVAQPGEPEPEPEGEP